MVGTEYMSASSMTMLLIEDNPGDARLICEMFRGQAQHEINIAHVTSMNEAESHVVNHAVDIILLDLGLPDAQGLAAVRRAHLAAPKIPLVVLTGLDDELLAMQALQAGAQDYFVKGQIEETGLFRALRYAIERKTLEEQLSVAKNRAEQAEMLLRDAVDSMSEGFVIYDQEDRFVLCNEAYRRLYPERIGCLTPGTRFEDILRTVLANRGLDASIDDETGWLAERLQYHHEAKGGIERQRPDGTWILATDRRMQCGGTAGLRIDVTDLKRAQAALSEEEARLDRAQAIAAIGSWELRLATGRYVWSKEMYRISGVSSDNFVPSLENTAPLVHPDDALSFQTWLSALMAGRGQGAREIKIVRPDGQVRLLGVEGLAVTNVTGVITHLGGTMQDITERRATEQQLAQAQKMEAIGNLTGGMAHDFNNGLAVIIGNLDMLGRIIKTDAAATELCDEARDGARRCADLIRLLLAFARRQPLYPRKTDVNELVQTSAKLLARALGEDVTWTLNLGKELPSVVADPAQLAAALTNLANNARTAMPRGGELEISTRTADFDARYIELHPDISAGRYVLIEFSDTGSGIAPEIIASIFEPFFTTKDTGQGSGLGLSMVFGFVKQSGGHLTVYSEPGRGTTFRIYLPCAEASDRQAINPDQLRPVVGGDEMVLLVEDNALLRRATARQLKDLGYQVREAEDAEAALVILASGDRVDLLFSDVVMPGTMDGLDLANLATRARRGLKILLTSGFPGFRTTKEVNEDSPFPLLNKPYSHDELARTLRALLDAQDGSGPAATTSATAMLDRETLGADPAVVTEPA
jgi:signal transduction histidine kinase/DNA-binding response OmpR family regulator